MELTDAQKRGRAFAAEYLAGRDLTAEPNEMTVWLFEAGRRAGTLGLDDVEATAFAAGFIRWADERREAQWHYGTAEPPKAGERPDWLLPDYALTPLDLRKLWVAPDHCVGGGLHPKRRSASDHRGDCPACGAINLKLRQGRLYTHRPGKRS